MQIPSLDSLFPNIFTQTLFASSDYQWLRHVLSIIFGNGTLKAISFSFIIMFLIGIVYLTLQIQELEKQEKARFAAHPYVQEQKQKKNERWEKVAALYASGSEADWRVAIIEADSMLDELLTLLKVPGGHIGEKLRYLDRKFFPTLDSAWNAHKVRNRIAHEGIAFKLDSITVANAMRDYEKVFRDMHYI